MTLRNQPPSVVLASVDGFTALSIMADLERRPKQYRAGWWAGYLIGRATEKDEATERRASRLRGAR